MRMVFEYGLHMLCPSGCAFTCFAWSMVRHDTEFITLSDFASSLSMARVSSPWPRRWTVSRLRTRTASPCKTARMVVSARFWAQFKSGSTSDAFVPKVLLATTHRHDFSVHLQIWPREKESRHLMALQILLSRHTQIRNNNAPPSPRKPTCARDIALNTSDSRLCLCPKRLAARGFPTCPYLSFFVFVSGLQCFTVSPWRGRHIFVQWIKEKDWTPVNYSFGCGRTTGLPARFARIR